VERVIVRRLSPGRAMRATRRCGSMWAARQARGRCAGEISWPPS